MQDSMMADLGLQRKKSKALCVILWQSIWLYIKSRYKWSTSAGRDWRNRELSFPWSQLKTLEAILT